MTEVQGTHLQEVLNEIIRQQALIFCCEHSLNQVMEISRLNLIRIFIQTVCGSNFFSEVLLKFVSITNKKYYYNNKYKLITVK